MGTRISAQIHGLPKCLVDIGGVPLIHNTIHKLKEYNIEEIGIVVGYKSDLVMEQLKNEGVQFFFNPFFDITNSIASLWFAREFLKDDEDCLLLNGDVYFEKKLLDLILHEKKDPVLFFDKRRKFEGDYRFYIEGAKLMKHGKQLLPEETSGEYIGVAKIEKNFLPMFRERLDGLMKSQMHHLWWENILYSFLEEREIFVEDVNGLFWGEVDCLEDYQRILHYRSTL